MSATQDTIINFLVEKSAAAWKENQPYLLSLAGSDMEDAGIDYRSLLEGEKLKAFAERTAGEDRYRFVKHPHQKAKLAIVPHGADFQFEETEREALEILEPRRAANPVGNTLIDFLNVLSRLPAEDLDGIVIPTRVLVKLAIRK